MLGDGREGSGSLLHHRVVRFLLAGGLAALINFSSRFVYSLFVDFSAAVVLAFFSGLTAGYWLNKQYVFTTSGNTRAQEIFWFVVINLFALLQTWVVSVYLARWLPVYLPGRGDSTIEMAEAVAHGLGILLPVFTSYIGHKYITFRE